MRMNKGICNLWRYVQIGEAINRRYLGALAEVRPSGPAIAQLDSLCHHRRQQGQRYAGFNPVSRHDSQLFQAVLAGAHLITSIANRDLQQQLWTTPPTGPLEARRRCHRVSRLIRKLRGHAILAKIPAADAMVSRSWADDSSPPQSTTASAVSPTPSQLDIHSGGRILATSIIVAVFCGPDVVACVRRRHAGAVG
jgi:hypothetical protein